MAGINPARHVAESCLDRLTAARFDEVALELAKIVVADDFSSLVIASGRFRRERPSLDSQTRMARIAAAGQNIPAATADIV